MADREYADDRDLPYRRELEMERMLSSIFIDIPGYGTRCTTILLMTAKPSALGTEFLPRPARYLEDKYYTFLLGRPGNLTGVFPKKCLLRVFLPPGMIPAADSSANTRAIEADGVCRQ